MGFTVQPASPNGGILFGSPTVFNASGTYTIPATALPNSQIMIETIGGGGAGNRRTNQVFASPTNDSTSSGDSGTPGAYFLGSYRLGFLYANPAGATVTVTVGAGGTGASYAAQSISGTNQNVTVNGNTGNAGGSSSVVLNGVTTASAAGGAYGGSNSNSATSSFYVGIDSTQISNIGPTGGSGARAGGTTTGFSSDQPTGGRLDFGATRSGAGTNSNNVYTNVNAGPFTPTQATDAVVGSGGGGGHGGAYWINATLTTNHSRGGVGAQPGGGGGGITGYGANNGVNVTYATNNTSGAGGAGRVRIWYAA